MGLVYPSTISTFILAGTLFKFNFHLVSQYNTENSCVLQSTNPHEPNPCCILSYQMILSENGAYYTHAIGTRYMSSILLHKSLSCMVM